MNDINGRKEGSHPHCSLKSSMWGISKKIWFSSV